tara:strand:- start:303 stop:437 length:135 start_codon:yes stop_codon:yes gene_type:complete
VLALPWGSASISNVFLLIADKEVAKLIEVVVSPLLLFDLQQKLF